MKMTIKLRPIHIDLLFTISLQCENLENPLPYLCMDLGLLNSVIFFPLKLAKSIWSVSILKFLCSQLKKIHVKYFLYDITFYIVDIIGEVIACTNLATVEKTGNIYATARLRDSFGETIDCTFWNDFARQMTSHWQLGVQGPIVVILTMTMIRKFGVSARRCLQNSKYGSRLYIQEDIPQINEYKAKLNLPAHSEQSVRTFSTLDKSQNSQEDFDSSLAFKGITELEEINEEGFFVIYGTILNIQSAYNWYYNACSKHNTKVDEAPNSSCRKCNAVPNSTELKFKLTVRIQDETGMASFVLFTPHIYPIVQKTAAELKKALEDEGDFDSFPDELDMLVGKKFLFKIEVQEFTLTQKTRIYTDPEFSKFVESYNNRAETSQDEDEAAVHLWETGGRVLSSAAFLVLRDIADIFSSNFNPCLSISFVAFISVSRATEITDIKQMLLLREYMVELCSLDVQKSSGKAVASMSQLAKILNWGLQTKKKEAVRKICSWEYVNCIDVWVRFISANIRDYDLQSLFFMAIQLINGVAHMFPGPRYFPLRLKCVEWLNHLASSSGNFIPLASLVLDILEYMVVKEGRNALTAFNIAPLLKLPKHYLKSRSFQDECFHSAIKQLSLHFTQWSLHISFPDLATIPLIRLGKVYEVTTLESLRRMLKRFIDQVEQNVDFVQKKRDDVSFSPHDQQSADSFLQLEKSSLNAPFTQYYKSVLDKAAERNLHKYGKISLSEQKNLKRNRTGPKRKPVATDQHVDAEENHNGVIVENGTMDTKRRKKALEV